MDQRVRVDRLLDLYGGFLTEKQLQYMRDYFDGDLSLSEIAENRGVSRQGVSDALRRASSQLEESESRLRLLERVTATLGGLESCKALCVRLLAQRDAQPIIDALDAVASNWEDGNGI